MKISLIVLVIFFSGCSSSEKKEDNSFCNCDKLQLDVPYNHFYITNRKEPYTGKCFKLNKKGDTLETINYNKGKVEGILTKYFESGKKLSETSFTKNKHDGDYREWNENGDLIFHGKYVNGKFDTILINKR